MRSRPEYDTVGPFNRKGGLPHAAARAVDVAGSVGDILSGELDVNGGEARRVGRRGPAGISRRCAGSSVTA